MTTNLLRIDGAPAAFVECQLCGLDACLAIADTDEQGQVRLQGSGPLDTPALKVGEGLTYAKVARVLPEGILDHEFPDLLALEMTDTLQGLDSAGEVSGQGVTIRLASDGIALVDSLSFPEPSQRTFRVVEVPTDRIAEVAPADLNLEALFGLGPVETELCPTAEITVPNTPGWASGTAVEFVLNGTDVSEEWAPYGGWARVSGGVVSDDGLTIRSHPDEGLPILGVVGVRLAEDL